MPRIPLPRRGVRSLVIICLFLWLGYQLVKRIGDVSIAPDATHPLRSTPKRTAARGNDLDPALALGEKQKKKVTPPPPLPKPAKKDGKKAKKAAMPQHKYLDNGLLQVNPKGQHPIYDLLEKGKEAWEGKLAKASKTLGQAVNEYRRRYGRAPPKGFDRWWKYAQENNVQLPDEYDQIHKDLDPFHALTPSHIQKLVKDASTKAGMYSIYCPGANPDLAPEDRECVFEISETGLTDGVRAVAKMRGEAQMGLLRDIAQDLEEVEVVFYVQDVPWQFVGHEYKGALEDAAAVGEYLNVEEHDLDWAHLGWASACAPHKPLRKSYDVNTYPVLQDLWDERAKTFIWDHKAAMDPCTHPTMTHLQGFLSGHGKGPGPSKELYPVMAMCKTTLHSDILAVSMENWTEDVLYDPPWEEKEDDRMLWKGKNTGIFYNKNAPWGESQGTVSISIPPAILASKRLDRINLVSRTAQTTGHVPVLPLTPLHKPVGAPKNTPLSELNAELMDVTFVDEPIQCEPEECARIKKEFKYGPRADWQQANKYKYMLDIDGNGWSARFKRIMSTNSLILKSTIFPEWYTDRIQPWVHYIPIKSDLTDLYDVLTFFRAGHDGLAKRIAMEGKTWSKTFWRQEDMISYQFRLFLELSRLMASDREEASYTVRGSDLD